MGTQEITAKAMLELLRLLPQSKLNLAQVLQQEAEEEQKQAAEPERLNPLFELANNALELSLSIQRMRAVAECFADDYIDTVGGITCAQAVAHSEDHYNNLYNALFMLIVGVDEQAEALHEQADRVYKELKAGA